MKLFDKDPNEEVNRLRTQIKNLVKNYESGNFIKDKSPKIDSTIEKFLNILELSADAADNDIQKAFRKLSAIILINLEQ